MKKIGKLLAVFFLVFTLVACGSSNDGISPAKVQEKIDAKETFIVVVTSTTCSYCKTYKPIVEEFTKKIKDVDLKEVVIDKLKNQEEKNDFLTKYSITGTPTTLLFKNGELATMADGVLSESELESLYNDYLK